MTRITSDSPGTFHGRPGDRVGVVRRTAGTATGDGVRRVAPVVDVAVRVVVAVVTVVAVRDRRVELVGAVVGAAVDVVTVSLVAEVVAEVVVVDVGSVGPVLDVVAAGTARTGAPTGPTSAPVRAWASCDASPGGVL